MTLSIPEGNDLLPEERYLTPWDFAKKYGWSYKRVLKLTKTKGFPSFKLYDGNRYYIDVAKVGEWLDIQKKKPKPLR